MILLRRFIAALTLMALLAVFPAAGASAPPRPVFALVIGIDAYVGVRPLKGAVNDARDIADALRKSGARRVVMLLNAEATRQRILDTIRELGAQASTASGTLVITYAGHGAQEPEKIRGDEADGLDEVLVLAGFRPDTADNAQRIRDNDIYAAFKAVPQNVEILFVADACHSGTLTRSADPRAIEQSTRLAKYGPIIGEKLPPPLLSTKGAEAEELPNVVFVASALDSEVTPELMIEGNWHGAVSWYFAKALGGAADSDANGDTTLAEFRAYLVNRARMTAESRQTPTVHYGASRSLDSFPTQRATAAIAAALPIAAAAPKPATSGDLSLPKIWTIGGGQLPSGAVVAPSRNTADFIWDRGARQVIANASGDVVAEQGERQSDAAFLAGTIDKWRAMAELRQLASGPAIPLDIAPRGAGARYVGGRVRIVVGPRPQAQLRYLTIVDIAGDGTVQNLYPFPGRPAETGTIAPDFMLERELRVQPPYGADHVIVIATAEEPVALRNALRGMEGRQAASEAVRAITIAITGSANAVSLVGLYSGQ